MARSRPTIAPTNALMTTSSANWGRFSRRPRRTGGATLTTCLRDCWYRCRAAVERENLLHLLRLRRHVCERGNERIAILPQHRIPPPLERDGARRLAPCPRTHTH